MQEQNNKTEHIVIGIFIIFVVFAIITAIFITKPSNTADQLDIPGNISFFDIKINNTLTNQEIYNIPYQIKNGGNTISEGTTKEGFISKFEPVYPNATYILQIQTDQYYHMPVNCTARSTDCTINVQKIASPVISALNYKTFIHFIIYIKEGMFKNAGICYIENSDRIINVRLDNIQHQKINIFENQYSECFAIGNLTQEFTQFDLKLTIDDDYQYKPGDRFKILIMDLVNTTKKNKIQKTIPLYNVTYETN